MKCSRCLLQLWSLRPLGQSAWPAAHCVSQLQSASCSQPTVLYQSQNQVLRRFHSSPVRTKSRMPAEQQQKNKSLATIDDMFERVSDDAKVKDTFSKVLDGFMKRDVRRRGHVEFIYAALKKMPEFGVERDITIYNKLLDVFPKEVFVARNVLQLMFNHYPRQQECGLQILEQMEQYGVVPNIETKVLLIQIFGEKSHPVRKYQRVMYWYPRFRHINPFPLPQKLPEDPVELSHLSLSRIANDLSAKITVYQRPRTDVGENGEEITSPHIVGIQSPDQMELLAKHNPNRPVFVEGPFPLWLKKKCVHYYILRADPIPPEEKVEEPYDPERSFFYPLQLDLDLERDFGEYVTFDVEDVDEGPVFAMCMTGQGDQVALNQWISGLQLNNPILGRVPTLFRLNAGPRELQESGTGSASEKQREKHPNEPEPEFTDEEEPQKRQAMKP